MIVEVFEVFGGYPVFAMRRGADLLHLVMDKNAVSIAKRRTKPAPLLFTFQSRAIWVAYASFSTG